MKIEFRTESDRPFSSGEIHPDENINIIADGEYIGSLWFNDYDRFWDVTLGSSANDAEDWTAENPLVFNREPEPVPLSQRCDEDRDHPEHLRRAMNTPEPETHLGQVLIDGRWQDYARGHREETIAWAQGAPLRRRVVDWIDKSKVLWPVEPTEAEVRLANARDAWALANMEFLDAVIARIWEIAPPTCTTIIMQWVDDADSSRLWLHRGVNAAGETVLTDKNDPDDEIDQLVSELAEDWDDARNRYLRHSDVIHSREFYFKLDRPTHPGKDTTE